MTEFDMDVRFASLLVAGTLLGLAACQQTPESGDAADSTALPSDVEECNATSDPAAWRSEQVEILLKFDAPDAYFEPDADACSALGFIACLRSFTCGGPSSYLCYDATGANQVVMPYQETESGITMPCTREQFEGWLAVEADDCAKSVGITDLPESAQLVLAEGMGASAVAICGNVSLTRFRIAAPTGTLHLVYLPMPCSIAPAYWVICASPAQSKVWHSNLPFLQCSSYSRCGWSSPADWCLDVESDCAKKCVLVGERTQGSADWATVFDQFSADFTGCP